VILGILATTAVLTPSPDPLTMLLAALPLYGLFELTLLCTPRRAL
jgi:Sec-independent protein secretion pathway component TatC